MGRNWFSKRDNRASLNKPPCNKMPRADEEIASSESDEISSGDESEDDDAILDRSTSMSKEVSIAVSSSVVKVSLANNWK